MHAMHGKDPHRPEESAGSPVTGVSTDWGPPG